jgi:hypothetical protein
MPSFYIFGKKIYSVDMMLCYLNINKPETKTVKTSSLKSFMSADAWGNPLSNKYHTPNDVLKDPKKYKKDYKKIQKSKLKYPIIMCNKVIIDGYHRLAKAYMKKITSIKVVEFDKKTLEKFYLGNNMKKINELAMFEYIKLFNERFCKIGKGSDGL